MRNCLIYIFLVFAGTAGAQENLCLKGNEAKSTLDALFDSVSGALSITKLVNGYFITGYNLKIEENCKERMPIKKLESFYRTTMAEGIQCLKSLANRGNEGSKNIACFERLFSDKSNPPKLLCGGWPFGNDISAVGSIPGNSRRHPYLWLSPEISSLVAANPTELKAAIFHEMLHNCGYTHTDEIEIPYTCEVCCFNNTLPDDRKSGACSICAGKYSNTNDPAYVKELLFWSESYPGRGSDMRMMALETAVRNKNESSLKLLLDETAMSAGQKAEALKILMANNTVELSAFISSLDAELKKDRIVKLMTARLPK